MEKEKKPFVSPEVEIVLLGEQDVIATSGEQNEWEDPNADKNGWLL